METIIVILLVIILATLFIGKWLGTDGFNDQDRADVYTTLQRTRIIMAQLDELITGLNAIGDDVDKLEQELQAAQQAAANNQPTDLTAALNIVNGLRSKLETTTSTAADAGSSTGTADAGSSTGTADAGSGAGATDPSADPSAGVTSGDATQQS